MVAARGEVNLYREIVQHARDIILVMHVDGRIIEANDAAVQAYGYSREELLAMAVTDLRAPESRLMAREQMRDAFVEGAFFETYHQRKDGSIFLVEVSSNRLFTGSEEGLVSVVRDISGRLAARDSQEAGACNLREQRYDVVAAGIVVQNAAREIVYANEAAERILGMPKELLYGKTSDDPVWQAVDEEGNPFPPEKYPTSITIRTGIAVHNCVFGIRHGKSGERRWLLVNAQPIYDAAAQRLVEAVATFLDITEMRRVQQALHDSEDRFRSLFSNMAEGVALHELVLGAQGMPENYRIMEVNESYERILGVNRAEIIGKLATEAYAAEEPPYLAEFCQTAQEGKSVVLERYFAPMDKHFLISVAPWGEQGFATIFLDITKLKKAEQDMAAYTQELERLASTDRLTGIWNRRYFEHAAAAEMGRAKRYGEQVALVIFDVDRLKYINDHYGHQVGDHILLAVTELFKGHVRNSDCLARWGGDEFIVLLPNAGLQEAVQMAEKLRILAAGEVFPEVGVVTLSMGVAELRTGENFGAWLKRADDALYQAKAAGRNRVMAAE